MDEENDKHFSNSKEELEYYKNTYKLNFEELSSCKSKIKVLENINNKLKEKITQTHPKNTENNDSSKVVFTNNEFKKFWEGMIQTELIESFDFCIKEYKLISHFSQDMMLLIYEETKKIIEQKFLDILKCLNLSKTSKDKKDSLYMKMMPFFRENFNNIFEFNEEKMKYIKEKLKNVINQYNFLNEIKIMANASSRTLNDILKNNSENNVNSKGNRSNRNNNNINPNINMNSEMYKLLENKIRGKNFEGVMKSFFSICLYMLLHDPVLNFDIEKYPKRKLIYYYYNKKDFINVEGFGNDKTPCVIILSPPSLKKKFAFNGLRPAVYTLSSDNVNPEILQQCKINEKKKEEENRSKENNEEIKDKKIMKYNASNEKENKLTKNTNISNTNININKNITNSKPLNYNQNTNSDKKKSYRPNKDDLIEYNTNTANNNMKNNYIKIVKNKSLKSNKSNSNGANLNGNNDSYKIINRNNININDNKNKLKNNFPNQKYNNNDMDKNNYILDNNNPKISHQNLSHSYIQIQNNIKDKNSKINIAKTKSNDKNNYTNDIKNDFYNNNINLMPKKEKTLQGKLQQKNNEFIIYDNNPFLNSSQKIERPKDIINNNYINQFMIIKDIYENNKQKDNISKNYGDHRLNNNSKSFDKKKKLTKNHTSNTNFIDNKNINIYLNEENQKNTYSKLKKTYIDKKINYNISTNNNNNLNYQNNYDFEKYPKSNGANTPSSEKINIKYYSSLGSILNNPNYNFSKQISDTNSNNNNNYYYTAEKRNNNNEYDFNLKEKKINFYSYGSNYNNNKNEIVNKYTERKGIIYPLNDSDYTDNINLSKNSNIINSSNIDIEKKKNYEPSSHKKNFNVLKISNNSKDKKQYYHSLKKSNLNPLFNFINNSDENNIKYTIYDLKEKHSLNNKLNYIDIFKSPNNINYYNNIYNNNSSLISCNNIYENLNNIDNFGNNIIGNSYKQLRSSINDNNNKDERRKKDKDFSRTTPESKNFKLGNNKMNKFGGQSFMEIKIKENNKKEINDFLEKYNQLSKERNQLEKCFAPIYLDVHDKTKKNRKIYDNQNNNNHNNIVNNQNEDNINIRNNNNFINEKTRILGNKDLLPKYKTYNEVSMKNNNKYNMMENNLNKKRNKSLNNNIQKIIKDENQNYYINNNISDIVLDENGNRNKNIFFKYSGDNINKIEYDDEYNDKENYNNSKGTNNTSYNLTNYYLNEIEVLKLNDKYKFNDE